ncbi:hypothetical protein LBMAG49_30120 [Planctomycetota bacterium]|nr:hypothetical protein LBMAG49_30120 [Planctomycetota bacterium]
MLREAWDGRKLQILTRNDPESATDAHISMIGHITAIELRHKMNDCESFNGFGNRILWVCSRRSRELPFGGEVAEHDLEELGHHLHSLIGQARRVTRVPLLDATRARWPDEYHRLAADRPGLFGALTSRAEAQVMRLALLYTLLDGKEAIDSKHLEAGLEVWRYCEDSVRYLFGDASGDATADRILDALLDRPEGMGRNEISDIVFKRNKSSREITRGLEVLKAHGRAQVEPLLSKGRTEERWYATGQTSPSRANERNEVPQPSRG